MCYCHKRDGCYHCVNVTGGMGGVIIVLMSQEGWEVLLLCYCHWRDICYYCVIVREGIGVIIVLLSEKG